MKHKNVATGGRASGFPRAKFTVAVVSLMAAAFCNVPAIAGPSALALTPIDANGAPTDADDTPALVIVSTTQRPEMQSDIHVPSTGIGSLYWALRHPARAWRILLPEQ
jgi:hypothetical protein